MKVLPSECLDYVRHRPAPSVESTIKQFNRIYGLVLTTILEADHPNSGVNSDSPSSLTSIAISVMAAPLQIGQQKTSSNGGRRSSRILSSSSAISGLCQDFDPASPTSVLLRAEMLAKWISIAAVCFFLR